VLKTASVVKCSLDKKHLLAYSGVFVNEGGHVAIRNGVYRLANNSPTGSIVFTATFVATRQ
jgi:hypothetical protein